MSLLLKGVQKANDGLEVALLATEKTLKAARVFAELAATNPIEAALRAAIQEIEDFITGIAAQTNAHALFIPIQKRYSGSGFLERGDRFSLESWLDKAAGEGTYTRDVLRYNTPETINFINHAPSAIGGNAGYWRTFILSLNDAGDYARPLFPENYAVAGVALIAGAKTLGVLGPIIDIIKSFLFAGTRANLMARILPVPRDLKARLIPVPDRQIMGVQLDWLPVPPVVIRNIFSTENFKIHDILVIRSTSPLIRQQFEWAQNFDFIPPPLGKDDDVVTQHEINEEYETNLIAQIKNTGFIGRYVDTVPLEEDKPYYYALALLYSIDGELQPVSSLSNVAVVYFRNIMSQTRMSEPPDWFMTPSLIQLFPILNSLVGEMKLFIAKTMTRTTSNNGPANLILQLIEHIQMLVMDAKLLSARLKANERRRQNIVNIERAGIRTTNIEVPTGGIQAWGQELARRLSDTSDPSRPPYDHDEYVAGVIILAGAPRLPMLRPFRELLERFFGEDLPGPLQEVVRTFDRPGEVRAHTFDDKLRPTRNADDVVTARPPSKKPQAFDPVLKPTDIADDC